MPNIMIVADTAGKLDARRKYLCGYLIEDWREQVEEGKDAPYDALRKELPKILREFREIRLDGLVDALDEPALNGDAHEGRDDALRSGLDVGQPRRSGTSGVVLGDQLAAPADEQAAQLRKL